MEKIVNGEKITVLYENSKIRVESIISYGNKSPDGFWYCQEEDEWVMLAKGGAELQFEGETVNLCVNENMYIPAYKKHRVSYASPDAEWLCVFVKNSP